MKYLCCADLHIRSQAPINRTDEYVETCLRKLKFILQTAYDHNACLLIGGDLFDSIRVGFRLLNTVIDMMYKFDLEIIIVPGNHDKNYHSNDLIPTPLYTLDKAGVVHLLDGHGMGEIYGAGWETEIDPAYKYEILLTHTTVTEEEPPFFLEDALSAQDMLDSYPGFKVIVSGDYHNSFVHIDGKRALINPGSMTRANIDQKDHMPSVYLYDDQKHVREIQRIEIPIKRDVFIDAPTKKDEGFSEEIRAFIEEISSEKDGASFADNLRELLHSRASKEVKEIVNEILSELQ